MRSACKKNGFAKAIALHLKDVIKVQKRVKRQLNYQEARYRALVNVVQIELDTYAVKLSKSKKPEENYLGVHFDDFYNYEYAEKLLRLWLDRCKLKQSLIYFQYRSKIAE